MLMLAAMVLIVNVMAKQSTGTMTLWRFSVPVQHNAPLMMSIFGCSEHKGKGSGKKR